MALGGFRRTGKNTLSNCDCRETLLARGPHKILAGLLANFSESILQIMDLSRLDVHLLVGVVSHVQALEANRLAVFL